MKPKSTSDLRIHDPKIVPPPGESELVTVEFSQQEFRLLLTAAHAAGCWSIEEL